MQGLRGPAPRGLARSLDPACLQDKATVYGEQPSDVRERAKFSSHSGQEMKGSHPAAQGREPGLPDAAAVQQGPRDAGERPPPSPPPARAHSRQTRKWHTRKTYARGGSMLGTSYRQLQQAWLVSLATLPS